MKFETKVQKEIYKDVPGYEGIYQVSNLGNVKSLYKTYVDSLGRNQGKRERILKAKADICGYPRLNLSVENKVTPYRVHELVSMAFLNHKPNGYKLVVDHINNNKLDNRSENLQLITQRHNASKDRKGYSSKYLGVCWYKECNKWRVSIYINGKNKHLGLFINEYYAHLAYQKVLKKLT